MTTTIKKIDKQKRKPLTSDKKDMLKSRIGSIPSNDLNKELFIKKYGNNADN